MKQLLVFASTHSSYHPESINACPASQLPLYHCHDTLPAVMLSASDRAAIMGKPTARL